MEAYEIVTSEDLHAAMATFTSRAEAQAAADRALPRRTRHNRPFAASSGYHWARAGRPSHDVWIVLVGNAVLLRDGTMYDHQTGRIVR